MHKYGVLLIAFFILPGMGLHRLDCQQQSGPGSGELLMPSQQASAGTTIAQIALLNRIPLGLVVDDKYLCANATLDADSLRKIGSQNLPVEFNRQLPSYEFKWSGKVLFGRPRSMDEQLSRLLEYKIGSFQTGAKNTHVDMSEALWTFLRAQLYPDQGTGFMGGVPPNEEQVEGFSSSNETVQQNLDHIVSLGSGAAWILSTSSVGWRGPKATLPFYVFAYVGDADSLLRSTCKPQ